MTICTTTGAPDTLTAQVDGPLGSAAVAATTGSYAAVVQIRDARGNTVHIELAPGDLCRLSAALAEAAATLLSPPSRAADF